MSSYRSSRCGCVCSDLELACQQLLHAFFVLDDHDQIYAFEADLQSPASACHAKEGRSTPSFSGPTRCDTSSMPPSKHETAFDHVRDYRDTSCVFQNLFRNSTVGSGHDRIEDGPGIRQSIPRGFSSRL